MESINWGYVFSTLIIRFIGVFIVLAILQIGMSISSKIIRRIESRQSTNPSKE
ncbi:MAG: hypothetical protein WC560_09255 [Syntrophales bacterium]